jgi:hypothetical protein
VGDYLKGWRTKDFMTRLMSDLMKKNFVKISDKVRQVELRHPSEIAIASCMRR